MTLQLWQRNVIGAVVAAAALGVGVTFVTQPAWDRYQRTVHPPQTAAAGESVAAGGQTWMVRNISRSTTAPGSGRALPEGTVIVNVLIERVGPSMAGSGCTGYLVAAERHWRGNGMCGAETSMPMTFLVPAATEPTAVDIRDVTGAILVRLEL